MIGVICSPCAPLLLRPSAYTACSADGLAWVRSLKVAEVVEPADVGVQIGDLRRRDRPPSRARRARTGPPRCPRGLGANPVVGSTPSRGRMFEWASPQPSGDALVEIIVGARAAPRGADRNFGAARLTPGTRANGHAPRHAPVDGRRLCDGRLRAEIAVLEGESAQAERPTDCACPSARVRLRPPAGQVNRRNSAVSGPEVMPITSGAGHVLVPPE
jgi:hypothetical protein